MAVEIGRTFSKTALSRTTIGNEGAKLVGASLQGRSGSTVQPLLTDANRTALEARDKLMHGGGTLTWGGYAGNRFHWSQRLILIPVPPHVCTEGYLNIPMPNLLNTVQDSAGNSVFNGNNRWDQNGVYLAPWESLWVIFNNFPTATVAPIGYRIADYMDETYLQQLNDNPSAFKIGAYNSDENCFILQNGQTCAVGRWYDKGGANPLPYASEVGYQTPGPGSDNAQVAFDQLYSVAPSTFEDDFARADGALGTSPSGHAWSVTGSGIPTVVNKQYTVPVPGSGESAGYASVELEAPSQIQRARYVHRSGGSGHSILALLCNNREKGLLTDVVHCVFRRDNVSIQIIEGDLGGSGTFTNLVTYNYASALTPGEYEVSVRIRGNTVYAKGADGVTYTYTDARFGQYWGARQTYEIINYPGAQEFRLKLASAILPTASLDADIAELRDLNTENRNTQMTGGGTITYGVQGTNRLHWTMPMYFDGLPKEIAGDGYLTVGQASNNLLPTSGVFDNAATPVNRASAAGILLENWEMLWVRFQRPMPTGVANPYPHTWRVFGSEHTALLTEYANDPGAYMIAYRNNEWGGVTLINHLRLKHGASIFDAGATPEVSPHNLISSRHADVDSAVPGTTGHVLTKDSDGKLRMMPVGAATVGDASTTVKGVNRMSTAPADPAIPIAVGDNDTRNTNARTPTDASVTPAKMTAANRGLVICTSATRPTTAAERPEGQHIYETDTDRTLVNMGTSATPVWEEPHGRKATQAQANAGADDTTFLTPLKAAKRLELISEKRGLNYEWFGVSWYKIFPGSVWIPATGRVLYREASWTSPTFAGLTPNAFYYIYAYDSGDGATLNFEHSTTAPTRPDPATNPIGDLWIKGTDYTRVLIGCFMAKTATTSWRWQKDGDDYNWIFHTEIAPFMTLFNVSLTSSQAAISVADVVPAHSRTYIGNMTSTGTQQIAVGNKDITMATGESLFYVQGAVWTSPRIPVSSDRFIQLRSRAATATNVYLNMTAFVEAL